MSNHRIYVLWNNPLFNESVRLLLQQAGIEWAGSSNSLEDGLYSIERLHPDTIFVEEGEEGGIPDKVIHLLETSQGGIRLFRLNIANNSVEIYYREQKTVLHVDELLQLVQNKDGDVKGL